MLTLNGHRVLKSGSAMMRSTDTLRVEDGPVLSIVIDETGNQPTIDLGVNGPEFVITVRGFTPGLTMTSIATGSLAGGTNIMIMTYANRVSEITGGAFYQVQYMISEAN
jgi:hypothetical protein